MSGREERLDRILDSFIEAVARGEEPDVEEILAQNPDLRDPLEKRLRGYLRAQSDLLKVAPSGRVQSFKGRVLGDFALIREIGSGGMGIVFEAEQIPLGRKVALKLLPAYRSLDPRQVERFRREASATAMLNHPGIIPVHSVGEAEGTHYIAMDLVEGEGLNSLLRMLEGRDARDVLGMPVGELFADSDLFSERLQPQPEAAPADSAASSNDSAVRGDTTYVTWAATVALEAARALHHAHANGIIHRDVKPGNILVRKGGRPVLVDFGLAHQEGAASMTATGEFLGSFHYVSPEQASSGAAPLDHRTDVYSLGVTFYEMLSLRVPFHEGTHHTVIDQILRDEPPALQKVNTAIPRDLATIVGKALDKDRNLRYETADDMADDLLAFLQNRPIRARPAGAATRVMKFAQRNRTLVGSALFVLVMAVVIGIGALVWWLGEEKKISRKQKALREKESALLDERTEDLVQKLRPVVEGPTPELAYLDLVKAIRGTPGNEEVQRKIIGYADTLRQKGLVRSAGRFLEEVLAAEPMADVAAYAHNVLGLCNFYYLQIDKAGEHWDRAAALTGGRTAAAHETRLNLELLRLCAPARYGLKELKTAAGGSMRINPQYATCLDTDDDGIDEIVVSCHGAARPLIGIIGWNEEGNLESRQVSFDWSCGVELGQINWFHRQCDGSGSPEFFTIASRQGPKQGLISLWRRSAQSQALTLCWSHTFDSWPADLARGDIDSDGHDEICLATNTRKLYVIDGAEGEMQTVIPVSWKQSDDEDISGLAVADIDGDGAGELLVVTSGHHRFGLFFGCLEEGRFTETGELNAGVLNGMAVLPVWGTAPPSLIVARGFTARRDDLDAKIDPRFDRSGFYRIAHEGSGWGIDSLWSPPREMGFWFAPRDPVVGRVGRSTDHFVIAFLNWRKELEGANCGENAGGVFLQPDRSSPDGWRGTAFTGQFLMATGQLDDDASSEIVLYTTSGLHVLGVQRPSHYPIPHVIGPVEPGGNFSNFNAMDQAGVKLIDLAAAVVDGADIDERATVAVQALADQAQFVLAHQVLDAWSWGSVARSKEFGVVHADLDLARGDYALAAAGYDNLKRTGAPVTGGLKMGGLSLDDRRRLAGKLLTGGTLLLDEGFETEVGGAQLLGPGAGTLTLQSDRTGQYGGRYERGKFAALRSTYAEHGPGSLVITALNMKPTSLWDGKKPFRLSFKFFASRLLFAATFMTRIVPDEKVMVSDPPKKDEFMHCALGHGRNSMSQEGDRYTANFNFPGRSVTRTGKFASEFVPDHWLEVEIEYIPALSIAHLVIWHVDRNRDDPPLVRSDVTAIDPPSGGPFALQFSLVGNAVQTDDEPLELEVFIDEVRFEVFD